MIVSSRIDSRLIHGQVVEAWLPHLRVKRLVVADDATATDSMAQAAMALAVPESVEVVHTSIAHLDATALAADAVPTLILFRDVAAALTARANGLPNGLLTLGNVHAGPGRHPVSRSVFLTNDETSLLNELAATGLDVVIQAVPSEKPLPLAQR